MSNPPSRFSFAVVPCQAGDRLDRLVAACVAHCSRSFAAVLIRQGRITVDGQTRKPGYVVKSGEQISGTIPPADTPAFLPEAIPLEILYEDDELLVVNKSPGIVVHPAPGHSGGTLANALMHHCPDLQGISGGLRPGIVHRLDKDTSGAMVVAKTSRAMHHLAAQFKSRQVHKLYLALVYGNPLNEHGSIDLPIGRHPVARKRMSVHSRVPRPALTLWQVREHFAGLSLLELDIRTGRTHQIRVHCKAIGHPVVGDPLYSRRGLKRQLTQVAPLIAQVVEPVQRQMLHARQLQIRHPLDDRRLIVEAPLPFDMDEVLRKLRMNSR
ncbi:RluA family pseudouridine synthase [Desulfosarcina ovata]|uniref:RluA family pseudouridine synthase n=1 Tax=Desulfosarcina ovata TaxID=83564 RepID=UPI0012D30472|nr:RluA family pseudouridine synthase [Desulfosarcina ovata]